jgi:DNA-binding MurR/RpiR family transcriptional regulator
MNRNETSEQDGLTAKQQRAIESLLREPTVQAAAEAAGVSKATIFRWLACPGFSAAYREARGRLLESTLTALQAASTDAVTCLREVINDKAAQVSARVSAAKTVLELGLKAREALEVEERLAYLEKVFEVKNSRKAS